MTIEPGTPPSWVICAGLPASASTWILNVVRQLLRHATGGGALTPLYIDERPGPDPAPGEAMMQPSLHAVAGAEALDASDCLVVKTHVPGPLMLRLARGTGAVVIVSVRDPRDAVCSMMARFGYGLADAIQFVSNSASAIAAMRESAVVLRYEDAFFDSAATVQRIASILRLSCDRTVCDQVWRDLSRDRVAEDLAAFEASGVFDPARSSRDQFEPDTHWHPGHIGDGRSGKWREMLTAAESAELVRAMRPFLEKFAYDVELAPVPPGGTVQFRTGTEGVGCLVSGFSATEPWGVWTDRPHAAVRIALAAPVTSWLSLHLICQSAPSLRHDAGGTGAISVNGRRILRVPARPDVAPFDLVLWLEGAVVAGRDHVVIELDFDGLRAPRDLDFGPDPRLLGVGLSSITLDYA